MNSLYGRWHRRKVEKKSLKKKKKKEKRMLFCGSKKGQNADSHRGKEVKILMKSESFHVFIRSGYKVQNVEEMIICLPLFF